LLRCDLSRSRTYRRRRVGAGDDAMKRLPSPLVLIIVALVSLLTAIVAGVAAALSGVYLYDRARSKGNDMAVALIAFHAAGTFAFVTVFTYLWSRRGRASWNATLVSFAACVGLLVFDTVLLGSAYDEYYATFFVAAWLAVAIAGIAALALSRYILSHAARQSSNSRSGSDSL
jgi:hypothetical protein